MTRHLLRLSLVLVLLHTCVACGNPRWWRSPDNIERSLLRDTPLGSSQQEVLTWLHARGIDAEVFPAQIEPNSDYPLSQAYGEAFIHESIGHYSFLFRTDVEAFYIFDQEQRLVDLQVRKTIDAL